MWQTITNLWSTYIVPILQWGGWGLFVWLLWYVFKHGEKLDKWVARIDKFLLWIGIKRDKQYVARDIKGKINSASKKINKEAEGVVTKGIDIVWVNEENIEAFLRSGKVVIRMRHHSNQNKNVVNAVMYYVKTGILHTGKRYLPEKIQLALDFSLTKKILSEEADDGTAIDYFSLNMLEPSVKNDRELEKRFSTIELMEDRGLLTRILLREIRFIGKKLYPRTPTQEMLKETERFFTFLEPFANHRGGDDDIKDWQFVDKDIQVGILYVAKQDTISVHGLEPYQKQLKKRIEAGCKRIYIFGRQKNNLSAIKTLTKLIQKEVPTVKVHREYYFELRGGKTSAICAVVSVE